MAMSSDDSLGPSLYHIIFSFLLASECSSQKECQPHANTEGKMTGMREIRKNSRRQMWVDGGKEDTARRSIEGQLPKSIPDHFHSRKCIYPFESIKPWS